MSRRLDAFVATDPDAAPLRVAAEVAAAVTPEALLVVGSSQPVRDLDLMVTPYPAGQRRLVIGNRGLAGIDGTVSTAIGAALGRTSSRAIAYLGDLTFLHDANGLVIGPGEPVPDLTIVVANDDGGAIFASLEQGARAVRGVLRAGLRHPARGRPGVPSARPAARRTSGPTRPTSCGACWPRTGRRDPGHRGAAGPLRTSPARGRPGGARRVDPEHRSPACRVSTDRRSTVAGCRSRA